MKIDFSKSQIAHDLAVQLAVKNNENSDYDTIVKNYILYNAEFKKLLEKYKF